MPIWLMTQSVLILPEAAFGGHWYSPALITEFTGQLPIRLKRSAGRAARNGPFQYTGGSEGSGDTEAGAAVRMGLCQGSRRSVSAESDGRGDAGVGSVDRTGLCQGSRRSVSGGPGAIKSDSAGSAAGVGTRSPGTTGCGR